MTSIIGFPDQVDEVSARLVAGGVVFLAAITILFDQPWLTALLAYGFIARVLTGPRLSPLGLLVTRVVRPRVPAEPRLIPGPPKRFAQAIGAVVTTLAAVCALALDWTTGAEVLTALMVVFATLESVFRLCVGCKIFAALMAAGVIPDEICAECANIWAR